jgi:hypothetical protein
MNLELTQKVIRTALRLRGLQASEDQVAKLSDGIVDLPKEAAFIGLVNRIRDFERGLIG